jgi:hypothetical protein
MKKYSSIPNILTLLFLLIHFIIVGSAFGQMYFHDEFDNEASLDNWETLGTATWHIENGELVSRDSPGTWNAVILRPDLWEGWTNYSYELTVTPVAGSQFIYQVFRYTQPLGDDRTNFFSYLMDEQNLILHIDRFLNGTRVRGLPGTSSFGGQWKNDTMHVFKIESTETTISGYLDGDKQFGPIQDTNLIDGRIGIGVWQAIASFDDVLVYGPDGPGKIAVNPAEKKAAVWGQIKAQY